MTRAARILPTGCAETAAWPIARGWAHGDAIPPAAIARRARAACPADRHATVRPTMAGAWRGTPPPCRDASLPDWKNADVSVRGNPIDAIAT